MTYREIARDLFGDKERIKKMIIILAVFACIISSVFFIEILNAYRNVDSGLIASASDEVVSTQEGKYIGGDMFNMVTIMAHNMGNSIEPISILFVEAIISILAKVFPEKMGQYSKELGIMNNIYMAIFIIVCFALLKFSRSNAFTKLTGLVAEDFENKLGGFLSFFFPFIVVMFQISEEEGMRVVQNVRLAMEAAPHHSTLATSVNTSGSVMAAAGVTTVLGVALCLLIGTVSLFFYYISRTVTFAGEIVSLPASIVPGFSLFIEILKTVLIALVKLLSIKTPWFFVVIFVIFTLMTVLLFKEAYPVIRYFKKIYIAPLFHKKATELIANPKIHEHFENVSICVPAFARGNISQDIKNYDLCWYVVSNGYSFLIKQKDLGKKTPCILQYSATTPYKIRKHLRFISIYLPDVDKPKGRFGIERKRFTVIVSRSYTELFPSFVELSGFDTVDSDVSWWKQLAI